MQVEYNGRTVDSDHFRVVMHHKDGFMRTAEGWGDYQKLLATGEWFESKLEAQKEIVIESVPEPIKRKRRRRGD